MREKKILGFILKLLLFLFIVMSSGCGLSNSNPPVVKENNLGVIEGSVVLESDQLSVQSTVQSGVVELCPVLGDGSEQCDGVVADVINGKYIFEDVDLSKVYIVLFKQSVDGNVESKSIVHNPESAQKVIVKSDVESDLITKFILEKIEDHELSDAIDHKVLDAIVSVVRAVVTKIVAEELTIDNIETTLMTLKNHSEIQQAETDFIVGRLEKETEPSKLIEDESAPLSNSEEGGITRRFQSKNGAVKVEQDLDEAGNLIKEKIIHTKESGEEFQIEKKYRENELEQLKVKNTEGEIITKSLKDDEVINVVVEKTKFEFKNQQYVRNDEETGDARYVKQRILSEFQGEVNVLEETVVESYIASGEEHFYVYYNYLVSKEDGLYKFYNGEWVKSVPYPLLGDVKLLNITETNGSGERVYEIDYNDAVVSYLPLYRDQSGNEFQDVYKFTIQDQESGENSVVFVTNTFVQIADEIRIEESVFDDFVAENNVDVEALLQLLEASEHHDQGLGVETGNAQENEVSEQISAHRFELASQQYVRATVEYNETTYVKQRILSEFQGEVNVLEETVVESYIAPGDLEETFVVYYNYLVSKEDGLYMFKYGEWVKSISYPLLGDVKFLYITESIIESGERVYERVYEDVVVSYLPLYRDQSGNEFQDVFKFTNLIQESGESADFYISKTGVHIMDQTEIIEESVFDSFVAENNIDLNVNQNSSIGASSVKTKNNSSSLALFRFSTN